MYSLSTVSNQPLIIASYAGTRFGWLMSMACRISSLNDHQKPLYTYMPFYPRVLVYQEP